MADPKVNKPPYASMKGCELNTQSDLPVICVNPDNTMDFAQDGYHAVETGKGTVSTYFDGGEHSRGHVTSDDQFTKKLQDFCSPTVNVDVLPIGSGGKVSGSNIDKFCKAVAKTPGISGP